MNKQQLHTRISYIKSGVRIVGFLYLPFDLVIGVIALIIAEVLGIIEEVIL